MATACSTSEAVGLVRCTVHDAEWPPGESACRAVSMLDAYLGSRTSQCFTWARARDAALTPKDRAYASTMANPDDDASSSETRLSGDPGRPPTTPSRAIDVRSRSAAAGVARVDRSTRRCEHKRSSFTGRVRIQLDERGQFIPDTGELIYRCCSCGVDVVGERGNRRAV